MKYTIDATGKKLGRIATEVAMILRGKNSPSFSPEKLSGNQVTIENASKIDLSERRLAESSVRYSGYPGGLTSETRGELIARKGYRDVFEKTIKRMLPANKLRKQMLKNLTVHE